MSTRVAFKRVHSLSSTDRPVCVSRLEVAERGFTGQAVATWVACILLGFSGALMCVGPLMAQESSSASKTVNEAPQDQFVRAAWRGDRAEVQQLLDDPDVEVGAVSSVGLTAWQAAKIRGYGQLATLLESKGAATNDVFDEERVALAILKQRIPADGPGVAVLVARGGQVVFQAHLGMANIDAKATVFPQTKFRIGSVTKQFAAACILKLQESGKLSVTDPLSKYLPDFPRGDEVTLHHLLTHTSGIHNFTDKPGFLDTVSSPTTATAMIDSFKQDPYDFDPGAKWSYSNSGYFLLGYVIEQVSGKTFEQYLNETLLAKLEMDATGAHPSSSVLEHEATGYSFQDKTVTEALNWDMSHAGAAGNLYSTAGDLHRWNVGIFMEHALADESLSAALTPVSLPDDQPATNYGYGWVLGQYRGVKEIGHNGGLDGFQSKLSFFPDRKLTIAVLRNATGGKPRQGPEEIGHVLADLFLWQLLSARAEESVDVDSKRFADYVGRYKYGPGAVLVVTLDDQQLSAQLTGQPTFPIYARGEDEFFWKVVDAQVKFLRDEQGSVSSAQHTQGGSVLKAPRLEDPQTVEVPTETLDKYVGKYSYGLLSKLTVRRDGNSLFAKMSGQPEFEIYAKSQNQFFWKVVEAEVEFVRGDDGSVQKVIHRQGGQTIEAPRVGTQ